MHSTVYTIICISCMYNLYKFIGHILHEKGLQRQKRGRSTGRQPGTKSASRLGDVPVMNRDSTAIFVYLSVYIGFRLFVLLGRRSGDVSSMLLESARKDCFLGEQFCGQTVLPDSAPPLRRAPRRDPPVVYSGCELDRLNTIVLTNV